MASSVDWPPLGVDVKTSPERVEMVVRFASHGVGEREEVEMDLWDEIHLLHVGSRGKIHQ